MQFAAPANQCANVSLNLSIIIEPMIAVQKPTHNKAVQARAAKQINWQKLITPVVAGNGYLTEAGHCRLPVKAITSKSLCLRCGDESAPSFKTIIDCMRLRSNAVERFASLVYSIHPLLSTTTATSRKNFLSLESLACCPGLLSE